MIKKIIFVVLLLFVIASCGKKGDPVYKALKDTSVIQNIYFEKA
jgi:predicted small lipoprotein YifL|tara:strand:- start:43 stop:174 length:132 start_codon:yes stop_codon:yes gene_type:complete